MTTVTFAPDLFEPTAWEDVETEAPMGTIITRLGEWPKTARLYRDGVSMARDVTPQCPEDVELLASDGPEGLASAERVYVLEYPNDPFTIVAIAVGVVALAAALFLFRPPKLPNQRPQSPNNDLSARTNEPRVGGRIPDIFGRVRAYPDLLTAPLRYFENNQEVEQSYMCVGRGSYELDEVRDGDTLLTSIAGASCSFFGPGTSPNSGDAPQLSVGTPVTDAVGTVRQMNDVNGQTLKPTNSNNARGDDSIRFVYPDTIQTTDNDIQFDELFEAGDSVVIGSAAYQSGTAGTTATQATVRYELGGVIRFDTVDPTTLFSAGDSLTLSNASYSYQDPATNAVIFIDLFGTYTVSSVDSTTVTLTSAAAVNPSWDDLDDLPDDRTAYRLSQLSKPSETSTVDLGGTYTVLSVSSDTVVLSNPVNVNSSWGSPLQDLPGSATPLISPSIATTGVDWVGPFVIDLDDLSDVWANFVALQGLYSINEKGKQRPLSVGVALEVEPLDDDDVPSGPAQTFSVTLTGDDTSRDSIGKTLKASPSFTGRCRVRARRTSPTDLDFEGTYTDEIKWKDCYGIASAGPVDFGDVTTVITQTYATAGATSVKERKFNTVATRKLPRREEDGSFTSSLHSTRRMADILAALVRDDRIGRRPDDELDYEQVYDLQDEIETYFGTAEATYFDYTFDDQDLTFEDTLASVAMANFCSAYRRGSVIRLAFEKPSEDSLLLFNHRNKMPGSEKRTVSFGASSEYDGVALDYVDPKDGAQMTLYVPQGDDSAANPKSIKTRGVASENKAHLLAWRAWNKIRYQNTSVEFEALPEADVLATSERILVADNTRPDTQDGEVVSQEVLLLTLSQRVEFEVGETYTIFLQGGALGVDAMSVLPDPDGDPYRVLLSRAPAVDLVMDDLADFRSTYMVVLDADRDETPFLVTEKDPKDSGPVEVTAINYDGRYYANDADVIDGLV